MHRSGRFGHSHSGFSRKDGPCIQLSLGSRLSPLRPLDALSAGLSAVLTYIHWEVFVVSLMEPQMFCIEQHRFRCTLILWYCLSRILLHPTVTEAQGPDLWSPKLCLLLGLTCAMLSSYLSTCSSGILHWDIMTSCPWQEQWRAHLMQLSTDCRQRKSCLRLSPQLRVKPSLVHLPLCFFMHMRRSLGRKLLQTGVHTSCTLLALLSGRHLATIRNAANLNHLQALLGGKTQILCQPPFLQFPSWTLLALQHEYWPGLGLEGVHCLVILPGTMHYNQRQLSISSFWDGILH